MSAQTTLVFGVLVFLSSYGISTGDIFSSTAHLQNLMYLERHMVSIMNEYLYRMEVKLEEIRNYLLEFGNSAGNEELEGKDDPQYVIGNPIQAFQLLKRLTINWGNIKELMKENDWEKVEELVSEYSAFIPHEEDLHGAALALVQLQDTYKLNMTDMAAGNLLGRSSSAHLTARDLLFLGKHSFNNGFYGHSIEWFEEAIARANLEGNTTAPVNEIMPFLETAMRVHDQFLDDKESAEYVEEDSNGYKRVNFKTRVMETNPDDYNRYQALCRGERTRTPAEEAHLRCKYTDMGQAYLKLQPVKMEEHSIDPYIVFFHDLMSSAEADLLREMAGPQLRRAMVQSVAGEKDEISATRTSQTAWFSTEDHPVVERINRRVSLVSNLSTNMDFGHSELMQIANYGIGGHYTPHFDYLLVDKTPEELKLVTERELQAGDRTATLMFYLSDVEGGGATVFPRVGVRITPKKGGAAFWFNLLRNGEAHTKTLHGACPVLLGEKWVANHWLREVGQTFRRRCTLNKDE